MKLLHQFLLQVIDMFAGMSLKLYPWFCVGSKDYTSVHSEELGPSGESRTHGL